jgi:hypothetical protein
MGLNKSEGASTVYLSVADGKLVRQHKQANANTTERVTKTGKTVHEEHFKDLKAVLVDLETRENDYGKQWQVKFKDGEENFIIQMQYSSRYATSFLKALPNCDLNQPIRFMPWSMQDKNDATKKVTGITLYQNSGKILPAYTKENPNGLPEMKQVKIKGKITWDDSDMTEFLEEMVKSQILPKLRNAEPVMAGGEEYPAEWDENSIVV